ncbi:branched-chain amino acid aminotransferase, putative [Ichthyophthirius multifiliis]|uniref:Branched-chain-amino-acid aminotransferase n=1 Tax=Ichthyophthirius multifiliis TaxID=5932 RepID=G0QV90_ICHMU|nr:branched-chain amino acid aminotransferase, putative [Ichthyophthirius multifiliis]EGR30874.1 branched-chain amino acid aminotransferase, putative [Ichthyophthirius multifiliis]|eukprot:XP_004032461.1 branched-chain amino acid aminotransferase, putative [Ichthyophthirius multifiliis]
MLSIFKNKFQNLLHYTFSSKSYYDCMDLSSKQTFYHKDLSINRSQFSKQLPELNPEKMRFGAFHTEHMLTIDFDQSTGWQKPIIHPFEHIQMHPFCSSIHYAIQCFEGTKAFKGTDGKIRMFRSDANMFRLKNSMKSLSLPDFDGKEFLKCIKDLVKVDERWVPNKRGFSLYIRPTGISMDEKLGVRAPDKAKLFCVFSPVGPYYPSGFKPIKLYCEPKRIRAAPGGTGNLKIGGNYGPTIPISQQAEEKGYQQVLWLWEDKQCFLENYFLFKKSLLEVGTSNIFFLWFNEQGEKELITPYLDEGTILPGVIRDTILKLTKSWGEFKVTERNIKIYEITKAVKEDRIIESFGCGTAVIVCPIEQFYYNGDTYKIKINKELGAGELAYRLNTTIQNIQYGDVEHEWAQIVE